MVPTQTPTSLNPISYNVEISPIIITGILLLFGVIVLIVLFRNGWNVKHLKKVKLGELELERNIDQESENKNAGGINVEVKNSTFHREVGDIGGVIIKSNKNSENAPKKK